MACWSCDLAADFGRLEARSRHDSRHLRIWTKAGGIGLTRGSTTGSDKTGTGVAGNLRCRSCCCQHGEQSWAEDDVGMHVDGWQEGG